MKYLNYSFYTRLKNNSDHKKKLVNINRIKLSGIIHLLANVYRRYAFIFDESIVFSSAREKTSLLSRSALETLFPFIPLLSVASRDVIHASGRGEKLAVQRRALKAWGEVTRVLSLVIARVISG